MRHRDKVNCPSCPWAQGFLKLQPNSTTHSPSPGFAIAENPEHLSKAHFEFDFSPADAASKRTHPLSMWGGQSCQAELLTAPQSPWQPGQSCQLPLPRAHPSAAPVLGETKTTSWPKGHLLTGRLQMKPQPWKAFLLNWERMGFVGSYF